MIPTEEKMEMETSDFFGTERISRILLKMAPPVMLAQLIQALYNIVDSLFVGRFSESGLTALSIIYPLLIFGLLGLPRLGVSGAAIATVAGQIVAALVVMRKGFRSSPAKAKISALY